MNAITRMIRKFSPQPAEPTNGTPPVMEELPYPVLMGIFPANGQLRLTLEDNGQRGFKQVIIPSDLLERYNRAVTEFLDVQGLLASLPTSNRKRKRRVKSGGPIG